MTLQEIAIFKRFIGNVDLRKDFIKRYRKSKDMHNNPTSVEEYLRNVSPENVIMSAITCFVINEAKGFDFWQKINEDWLIFFAKMKSNHSFESDDVFELKGYYYVLRENWDSKKPWVYEPVDVARLRLGLITPEEVGVTLDNKNEQVDDEEDEPTEVEQVEVDPLANFDFFDLPASTTGKLGTDEVSLNTSNSFKLTFNMHETRMIIENEMAYARLAKSKTGDICVILNKKAGARISYSHKGKRTNNNACINSKDICSKIHTLLNINGRYTILHIEKLPSDENYIIYKLTK